MFKPPVMNDQHTRRRNPAESPGGHRYPVSPLIMDVCEIESRCPSTATVQWTLQR